MTPPDAAPDAPPAPAVLTMTPMTSSFGSVSVGSTGTTASFTITNTGGSPSGTITPIITGTNAGDFADANGCATLAPLGTCTVTVTFKPTSAGGKTANLVASASPGGSVMANLDGSGVALGNLTINPGSQSFGTQTVGVAVVNNDKTFTITNGGGTASGALTVTAAGSDPGEFSKTADTCSGQMIAAAGTCTLTIRFAPLSSGSKSASFDIVGTPGGTLHAAVSGIAVNAAAISVTPSVQNFGTVVTGGAPTSIVFTVTNTGGVTTGALANSISGDPVAFTIANSSCTGATLVGGGTCNITVNLNGSSAGAKNGSLDVTGAPGGSDSSILSGQVNSPGSIISAPGNLAFAATTVGGSTGAQTITVSNTGGSATGALNTALGGNNAADFQIVTGGNGCQGAVLAPMGSAGSTCTISVLFHPLTAGLAKAGSVTITGAPGGNTTTTLSGDGITAANLVFSPASKDFGSVTTGTNSATQDFTITNMGGQTSAAVVPSLGGADAGEFMIMNTTCAGTLAPMAFCDVVVLFHPTSVGAKNAAVNVTGASAAVSGNGLSPASITPNPTNLTFAGNTLIGDTTVQQTFTITNNGSSTTGTIAVTLSGAAAGDYTISANNCTTLIANGTCQVSITFHPSATGARLASVDVIATPGGSFSVGLSGNGQRKLEITVPSASPFDFGNVNIVGFGPCQIVTVRNNTLLPITLGIAIPVNVQSNLAGIVQPGVPQDFDLNNAGGCANPPATRCAVGLSLGAGATCNMTMGASPDMPGAVSAFIRFSIGAAVSGPDTTQQDFTAVGFTNSLVITPCTGGNCTAAAAPSFQFGNVNIGTTATQVFTLLNQTMATTGILETQISSNADYHVISDTCAGFTLAINATCTVTVIFQPTVAGVGVTATLHIHDVTTLPISEAFRAMDGTGIKPAKLTGAPATFAAANFGTVIIGEQSSAAGTTFVISNTGNVNSGPITVAISSPAADPNAYQVVTGALGDCVSGTTIIGPFAGVPTPQVVTSCNVRVKFAPTFVHANALTERGTLTVTGAPGGVTGVTSNLVAISQSTITIVALGSTTFPNTIVGQVSDLTGANGFRMNNLSATQTVTFAGGTLLPGTEFTVVNAGGCASVAPLGFCLFDVRFAPTGMPDVQRGPETLTMNATNGQATLGGIFATAKSVANLVLAPSTGDFGSVLSGTGTSVLQFTLTNTGFQTATGIAVTIPNANGNYSQTNTCGAPPFILAGGGFCTVTVTFAPPLANTGVLNATLTVGSTLGGAPTVALTGTGISTGVTVNPATADFGVAAIGEKSAKQVFALLNTSAAPPAVALSLTLPADYVIDNAGVANPCGATLAPIASCNVGVRFAPGSAGVKAGKFVITGGTYAAVQGVGLSNANIAGLADHDFGTVTIAGFRVFAYIVTNNNVGPTGPLNDPATSITGTGAANFVDLGDSCNAVNLQPGQQCVIFMAFNPQVLSGFGPQTATLTLTSNAVGPGGIAANSGISVPITLTGTGANTAALAISPMTPQADGARAVGKLDGTPTVFTINNLAGSATTGPLSFGMTDNTNFVFTTVGLTNAPCVNGSTTLAASAKCDIGILYHPTVSLAADSTTLTVTENDGVTPSTVNGTVTGSGTPQITGPANPTVLTANANTVMTFTNQASVATNPVVVNTIPLGTQVSIVTDNCVSAVLPPGGTCTITVKYVPNGLGGATGAELDVSTTVNLTAPPYGVTMTTAQEFACSNANGCLFSP